MLYSSVKREALMSTPVYCRRPNRMRKVHGGLTKRILGPSYALNVRHPRSE